MVLLSMIRLPPISTLFPYTTLFRSPTESPICLADASPQKQHTHRRLGHRAGVPAGPSGAAGGGGRTERSGPGSAHVARRRSRDRSPDQAATLRDCPHEAVVAALASNANGRAIALERRPRSALGVVYARGPPGPRQCHTRIRNGAAMCRPVRVSGDPRAAHPRPAVATAPTAPTGSRAW